MVRERDVEKHLVTSCREAGIYCRKWSSPGRRGVPDRLLLHAGEWFAVEVKAPGKSPTGLQSREMRIIMAHGGKATWVDSIDAVDKLIMNIRLGLPL